MQLPVYNPLLPHTLLRAAFVFGLWFLTSLRPWGRGMGFEANAWV
jgi:hypothetical protein